MGFQKVEFEFPDTDGDDIDVEPSSAQTLEFDVEVEAKTTNNTSEDDIEVEVVDDTPEKDRGRKPSDPPEDITEDELADYSDKVRKRIKHFSKGYHDERRAKEQALRERQELERVTQQLMEENRRLKGDNNRSREVLLDQARKTASSELEQAKRAYKEAYETGDADAVLEAQENLTNVKIKVDKLENFKLPSNEGLENNQQFVSQQVAEAPSQPVQTDARAADWASKNTWFGTDDEMTAYALGLHNKLVKSGIDPTSDNYYETIDSRMRTVFPDNFEDTVTEAPSRKRSNVVAPATRSTAPKKVKLTQTQARLAKRLGLTPEQYAKQVALDMRTN